MPELPEVETSRRGIEPHVLNQTLKRMVVREHRLRWPVPRNLSGKIQGKILTSVRRRGKYLLLQFTDKHKTLGHVIMHLGMSGSLRICTINTPFDKHDHVDFIFSNDKVLRLRDPRKFGCVLWAAKPVDEHKLLASLGPEPISDTFNGDYLYSVSRKRTCSIKSLIMNSQIVVGVGNIYASESLFLAGIHPRRKAGSISKARCEKLADAIKQVLLAAIEQGGTTLRDFTREDGQPGYFSQELYVYGRVGKPCRICGTLVKQITQHARSTYYCTTCQK